MKWAGHVVRIKDERLRNRDEREDTVNMGLLPEDRGTSKVERKGQQSERWKKHKSSSTAK